MSLPHYEPPEFHPSRPGLVMPVRRDFTGRQGPTQAQARTSHWRRTSRGLYVPAHVDGSHVQQRVLEAAALLPRHAGVTGWAALAWQGGAWFGGLGGNGDELPVSLVACPDDIRAQPGIRPSAERLDPRTLQVVDGVRVTTAVRSVCFEMRYAANLRQAVVAFSSAAFNDLVGAGEVRLYAAQLNGWTGIPQCREALGFIEENAWSPQEMLMSLLWQLDGELPRPRLNAPVFDLDGRHIGTPDLLDPEAGVIGQYDGSVHLAGEQRARDLRRDATFVRHGLETVTMVAGDWRDPVAMVARIHAAYRRAARRPVADRRWTLDKPAWWTPTETVAQRRALSGEQRSRLLGHRAA